MVRSCARRSLAAETIFMALVICWVFLTERIRRRMSIRLGMRRYRWLLRDKPRFEFRDRVFQTASEAVVQRFLVPDLVPNFAVRVVHKPVQLFFELAALLHRQIIQKTLGAGENDDHLFFERQRLIL